MKLWMVLAAALPLLAGCFVGETEVAVKADGSGTIRLTVLMSPEARQQMTDVLEVLAKLNLIEEGTPAAAMRDFARGGTGDPLKDMTNPATLRDFGAMFGPGVQLVRARNVQQGNRHGVEAEYRFADIRTLRIAVDPAAVEPAAAANRRIGAITFSFTRLQEPLLKILPPMPGARRPAPPPENGGWTSGLPGVNTSLERVFAGIHLRATLRLAGPVTRGNAAYREGEDRVVLAEVVTDRMRGADIARFLRIRDYAGLKALQNPAVPGIRLQPPGDVLLLHFRPAEAE